MSPGTALSWITSFAPVPTRPRRWADLLALPRGSGLRGHGLTLEGARVPELQALAGLGHTLLCCLLTSKRHPLVVRRCVSLPQCPRAHVCIRIAVKSPAPSLGFLISWDWGGAREFAFLTSPSGTLVLLSSLKFLATSLQSTC